MHAVIALDLDGVLNPDTTPPGWTTAQVTFPTDPALLPNSAFLNPKIAGRSVTVNVPPPELVAALVALPATIRWATTWEQLAIELYTPAAGLPVWDVIVLSNHPARFGYVKSGDAGAWKMEAFETEIDDDAVLVVIDDRIYRSYGAYRQQPTLIVTPDAVVGLTFEHVAEIARFLAEHGITGE